MSHGHLRGAAMAGAVAVLTVLGGCATSGSGSRTGNPFGDRSERNEVQIKIRNFNFSDATVWVLTRGAQRKRLGVVTGKSDADFTVPWDFSQPMTMEFDLVAGPRCTTRPLEVDPGDVLELQIAVDFAQMSDWCR
ncbi:MAG: hypothetical protein PVJ02_17000 [Gemmatimonadota bacterium]|jgi:hypothetical protein